MKEKFLLTIKADDAPGLLARVIVMLTRRRIEIESVTMSRTDINTIVLITVEIFIEADDVRNLQLQLGKIIEVISTHATLAQSVIAHKLAFFKLSTSMFESAEGANIERYGARIVKVSKDAFIISKSGSEDTIKELYNKLEGKYLMGFAQTGVVADTQLLEGNDEWRISRLAA